MELLVLPDSMVPDAPARCAASGGAGWGGEFDKANGSATARARRELAWSCLGTNLGFPTLKQASGHTYRIYG